MPRSAAGCSSDVRIENIESLHFTVEEEFDPPPSRSHHATSDAAMSKTAADKWRYQHSSLRQDSFADAGMLAAMAGGLLSCYATESESSSQCGTVGAEPQATGGT